MTNLLPDNTELLHVLSLIRVTQGAKAKQELLKSLKEYTDYFELAYSPFINFHITADRIKDIAYGKDNFLPSPSAFLPLISREVTGNKAVDYLYQLCHGRTKELVDFILMIIDKDLKLGMAAKSLNKVFPGLIELFEIMLAERENREKFNLHYGKYEWVYFNEKIDGIRCVVEVKKDGCKFLSRTGKPIPDFLTGNIEAALVSNPEYHNRRFDGEIASMHFHDLQKVIMRKNADMDSIAIRNAARFYIFDLPDSKLDLESRVAMMEGITESLFIKKLKYYKVKCDFALIKEISRRYVKAGKEGIIIKKPDAKYEGKRSFSWMKFKGKESLDLRIIGTEPGEPGSKYENTLGALVLDYEGKPVNCGTGFTDEDRDYLWSIRESLIGKICQISFMEKTNTDSLRHPVFEVVRFDKGEADETLY